MKRTFLILISLFAVASPAFAHKLLIDSRIKGDRLHVEVFYEDDTPAQQAKVVVLEDKTVVAEGRTDEKGVWSCPKPKPGTYTVKAESLGHGAKELIKIGEAAPKTSNPDSKDAVAVAAQSEAIADDQRAAKTRTPWSRIGLGLAAILGLTVFGLLFSKSRTKKSPSDTTPPVA